LRQAQVRPAQWADLFRKHQDAQQTLADLQQQHKSLHGNLLQIKELRAVAPLLTSYDHALSVSNTLRQTPLLPLSAVADRAAAQSGLAAARRSIDLAEKEAQQQQVVLDALDIEDTLLKAEQSIRRLCSEAAAIDALQRDMADAQAQTLTQDQRLAQMAKGIHAELCADALLAQSPTRTQKTHIDQLLRHQEQAHHALTQHQEHASQNKDEETAIAPLPLPNKEARNALQVVQAEVARAELVLQQLSVLPTEVKIGQRALETALNALNFSHISQLQQVRPMVDAQLDEALTEKMRTTHDVHGRPCRYRQSP
jgi:DNA repair protein SbcC/Rad50